MILYTIVLLSSLLFGSSAVISFEKQWENIGLNGRKYSNNQSLDENLNNLNEVLSYLVKRIENNPIVLKNREFLKEFMPLINKITDITANVGNSSINGLVNSDNVENLKWFQHKFNNLINPFIKTSSSPLNNTVDNSSGDSFDYWNIVWKLVEKIDNQLPKRGTTLSINTTITTKPLNSNITLPSDSLKNMIIFKVLTQIKYQIATNETLRQLTTNSLSVEELISKVVSMVDKTLTSTTTPKPTPTTTKPNVNGFINSIFSRIKNLFNYQIQRATTLPSMTTPLMISITDFNNEQTIKDIVSQIIAQIMSESPKQNLMSNNKKELNNSLIKT